LKKLIMLLAFAVFIISGCASTNKRPFVEITDIPQGRGVVYIYMPQKKNLLQTAEVRVDNSEAIGTYVGNILKGTYIPYIAPLGENLFKIGNKAISLNVIENEASFIKIESYKVFFKMNIKLAEIDPSAGFVHIRTTQQR